MLGTISPRLTCSAMWRSAGLASRLPQLGLRSITTKQPTKSTAAAAKLAEFDDLDEQQPQQQRDGQDQPEVPRKRWQAPTSKIPVIEPEPDPVHTCETAEEQEERLRTTYFQYAKDAGKGDTLPASEWRGVFHMMTRSQGMSSENVQLMRSVVDFDQRALDAFRKDVTWQAAVADQKLRTERLNMLGPDLAAAHFIVFRDGRIRFHGDERWHCRHPDTDEYDLPTFKTPGLMLKDVDASKMNIIYEGLENLDGCTALESINLSHCLVVDNWFIDRICYQHSESLLSLDLSHCPRLTVGAITGLARLKKLRRLNVTGLEMDHLALACLSLEDELPGLEVTGINYEQHQTTLNEEQVEQTHSYLRNLQTLLKDR